jgi:pilus assembly protein CpaE
MLDIEPATTLIDAARERQRLDATLVRRLALEHSSGLHLLAAPPDAIAAAAVDDDAVARLLAMARRAYDIVIVDTFPVLDGVVMAALDLCDVAYAVVQPTVPAVVGAARLLAVLAEVGVGIDRQRLVLNQGFRPIRGRGGLGLADIEERIGRVIDHLVPYTHRLVVALNTGRPDVLERRLLPSRFRRAVAGLARDIERLEHSAAPPSSEATGEPDGAAAKPLAVSAMAGGEGAPP